MSETRISYLVSGLPLDPNEKTLLLYIDPNYERPTASDLRCVIRKLGLTGSEVAGRVGVSPDNVRKWQAAPGTRNAKPIPYSAWRLLLIEAGLVPPPRAGESGRNNH